MFDPGVNQRDHSNNNADSVHENLDNKQQKIANLGNLFDQESHSLQYLTPVVKRLAKTAKSKHSKRKRRYATSSSSSSRSSSSDEEPPRKRKTTNPNVNSDTEQEALHLMNQGKQKALIVSEDSSSENPTASSTGQILNSIDDDSNEGRIWTKKFRSLCIESQRKMADKVNIRESQGQILESSNT